MPQSPRISSTPQRSQNSQVSVKHLNDELISLRTELTSLKQNEKKSEDQNKRFAQRLDGFEKKLKVLDEFSHYADNTITMHADRINAHWKVIEELMQGAARNTQEAVPDRDGQGESGVQPRRAEPEQEADNDVRLMVSHALYVLVGKLKLIFITGRCASHFSAMYAHLHH